MSGHAAVEAREDLGTLGGRIRTARKRRSLYQRELAERVHVKERAVRTWELGSRRPRADTMRELADVLQVPLDWLVEGPASPTFRQATSAADELHARAVTHRADRAGALVRETRARRERFAGGASPAAGRPAPQVGAAPTSPNGTQPEGAPRRGV